MGTRTLQFYSCRYLSLLLLLLFKLRLLLQLLGITIDPSENSGILHGPIYIPVAAAAAAAGGQMF